MKASLTQFCAASAAFGTIVVAVMAVARPYPERTSWPSGPQSKWVTGRLKDQGVKASLIARSRMVELAREHLARQRQATTRAAETESC
jgi:hypothetical protein